MTMSCINLTAPTLDLCISSVYFFLCVGGILFGWFFFVVVVVLQTN